MKSIYEKFAYNSNNEVLVEFEYETPEGYEVFIWGFIDEKRNYKKLNCFLESDEVDFCSLSDEITDYVTNEIEQLLN